MKMTILGLEFEDFNAESANPWDYGIVKGEGKGVKYIWLDRSVRDFGKCEFHTESHRMECSPRGAITLDGKRVVDKKEAEQALNIFKALVFRKG